MFLGLFKDLRKALSHFHLKLGLLEQMLWDYYLEISHQGLISSHFIEYNHYLWIINDLYNYSKSFFKDS